MRDLERIIESFPASFSPPHSTLTLGDCPLYHVLVVSFSLLEYKRGNRALLSLVHC